MPGPAELSSDYDLVVVGGGVHGAATAMEAARAGHRVLIAERNDFCSGTSANSLRIIHGGLRYLQSGDLRRSRESARAQSELLRRAPHLVREVPCLLAAEPGFARNRWLMAAGLQVYDRVVCFGMSRETACAMVSGAQAAGLSGRSKFRDSTHVAMWPEAQVTDPERLVLTYLKTAEQAGATLLNYATVTEVKKGVRLEVIIKDDDNCAETPVQAAVVIDTASLVAGPTYWARGVNLVLNSKLGECIYGLRCDNDSRDAGRLFFVAPSIDGGATIGTWYFPDRPDRRAVISDDELQYCIEGAGNMLGLRDLAAEQVSMIHVGRLPVRDGDDPLSLLEKPLVNRPWSGSRLVTLSGVKYTTALPSARRALSRAGLALAPAGGSEPWYGAPRSGPQASRESLIERLAAHMESAAARAIGERLHRQYGGVSMRIIDDAEESGQGLERIPGVPGLRAEISYCIEHEYCRRLSDFIMRRSGLGTAGRPANTVVEYCAAIMAEECRWSETRKSSEINALLAGYQRVDGPDPG